jgi:hypothetical protein
MAKHRTSQKPASRRPAARKVSQDGVASRSVALTEEEYRQIVDAAPIGFVAINPRSRSYSATAERN